MISQQDKDINPTTNQLIPSPTQKDSLIQVEEKQYIKGDRKKHQAKRDGMRISIGLALGVVLGMVIENLAFGIARQQLHPLIAKQE
ncbi:MAG: hypothetical protein K9I94_15705 [Bacteroidales bacterium]|nr:hypothetical protein [Bacteroidales bacterium]